MKKKILVIVSMILFGAGWGWNHWRGKVAGVRVEQTGQVGGIVLPHHNLAKEIIMQSLERLARTQNFSHIVIFSPNHYRPESYTFTSAKEVNDLPLDMKYLSGLEEADPDLVWDQKLLEGEHGIIIPAEYLKHYFPGAKFVPIIFSPYFEPKKLERAAGRLAGRMPEDTLFVVSVDFAHEEMVVVAAKNNEETVEVITTWDYQRLFNFGNEHLDSPAAMGAWMMIMEKIGAKNWETWHDSHGAMLTNNPLLNGTSYVIGVFRKN